jgi:hypothetical protein
LGPKALTRNDFTRQTVDDFFPATLPLALIASKIYGPAFNRTLVPLQRQEKDYGVDLSNTHLGDGWHGMADNDEYAAKYSIPLALPMGTNAVVYALTK